MKRGKEKSGEVGQGRGWGQGMSGTKVGRGREPQGKEDREEVEESPA